MCYFFFDLNARNALPLFFNVYLSGVRVCFFFDLNVRNQLLMILKLDVYRRVFIFLRPQRTKPTSASFSWSSICGASLFFLRPQRTKPIPVSFRCLIPLVGPSTGLFSSFKSFSSRSFFLRPQRTKPTSGPKEPQDSPHMAPGMPRDGTRRAHSGPKMGIRWL